MIPIGAGTNRSQAERRALVHERGEEIRILNFGWRPIGCPPVADGRPGTNTMGPKHVLSSVYRQKEDSPTSSLVCIVHWNYEMELYPQPAHRQLAFAMIDAGADLVVGHHPHRVGGYEVYRGKPIVYSLGNFWLPHGYFFNGKLAFAPDANLGLALEWHPSTTPIAHWFQYEPDTNHLSSIGSEPMQLSEELATRTPFMGLDHARYQRWFRENRTKKRILPIYKDMDHELRNHARDALVKARHQALVGLEASGLRRLLGI